MARFTDHIKEDVLMESIEDKGIYKAVFMAGVPGSGKSYTISKVKSGQIEPRIVNTDPIIEYLNTYKSNVYSQSYNKAKQISKIQLVNYLNGVLPLFVDTTSGFVNILRSRVHILEKLGYDTALIFVNTSLDTAMARAEKRGALINRQVDPEAILDYNERLKKYKNDIKGLFSFNIEINNDEGELTDDVILKAYKKIYYFYDTEIENPIGKERYDLMRENNWHYLTPNIMSMDELKNSISMWYGH